MRCAVFNCNSDNQSKCFNKEVMFFRFPRDKSSCEKWVVACGRSDKFKVENSHICSLHFSPSDYARDLKAELLNCPIYKNKRLLKDCSVPLLHLPLKNSASAELSTSAGVEGRIKRASKRNHRQLVETITQTPSWTPFESLENTNFSATVRFGPVTDLLANQDLFKLHKDMENPSDRLSAETATVKREFSDEESCVQESLELHNEIKPTLDIKLEEMDCTDYSISDSPHLKTETPQELFEFINCDYTAAQSTQLEQHMKVHTGKNEFRCTLCDYACSHSSTLTEHMSNHTGNKPFKCTVCDYACAQSTQLTKHMRTHTGEKPFKCTKCDYAYAHRGSLTVHLRKHTGEKPYKCTICDNGFAQSAHLKMHIKQHTREKPFKCTVCDQGFTQATHLAHHMRKHTGEKPFKCTICDYGFSRPSHLTMHMRKHTGEKPFKCSICDFACAVSSGLTVHMRRHTGEKPFKCTKCDFACIDSTSFRGHITRHTWEKQFK